MLIMIMNISNNLSDHQNNFAVSKKLKISFSCES